MGNSEINKQNSTDNNSEVDRFLFVIMSVLVSIFLSCIAVLTLAKIADLDDNANVTFIVVFIISLFCFFSAYERSFIIGLKYTVPILMGIIILIFAIQNINDKPSKESTLTNSSTTDQNTVTVGGSGCESSIERRFKQVNKLTSLIGYIGNGEYAVTYEELDGTGGIRTAKVTIDSNCNIIKSE